MNIQLQVCGLLMMLMLLIFYRSHKILNLYSERVFFRTLTITIVTIVFDILSIVAIRYRGELSNTLVLFVCKTYLNFLLWSSWATFTYILLDYTTIEKQRKITMFLGIIVVLCGITTYILPISIFEEGIVAYTYGASVVFVYYCCAAFIFAALFLSLLIRKKRKSRRSFGGIMWTSLWIVAALIQYNNNELLLVGFVQALGMLIMFILMENPESYIDNKHSAFRTSILRPYLEQLFETKKTFHIGQVYLVDESLLLNEGYNVGDVANEFIETVMNIPKIDVFKDVDNSMFFVSLDIDAIDSVLKLFFDIKNANMHLKNHAKMISIKNAEAFRDYNALNESILHAKEKYIIGNIDYLDITKELIDTHEKEKAIDKEIDKALQEDRVEVFLQPIFSNKTKSFVSAEALVRIRNTDGSLLSPGAFIPLAEKNGKIIPLGYRVMEKVFEFIGSNNMEDLGLHYIEINLSVEQCEKEELFSTIVELSNRYNVLPKYVNFEITESATINSKEAISSNMKKLFDAGFTFTLDDFGKGESNLMYIVDMPVSVLKFDIDMTKAYFESYKAMVVTKSIISMAHELDLQLVSEGIETAKELEIITKEGVDYIQGYYYSKPLPVNDFINFIKEKNN